MKNYYYLSPGSGEAIAIGLPGRSAIRTIQPGRSSRWVENKLAISLRTSAIESAASAWLSISGTPHKLCSRGEQRGTGAKKQRDSLSPLHPCTLAAST